MVEETSGARAPSTMLRNSAVAGGAVALAGLGLAAGLLLRTPTSTVPVAGTATVPSALVAAASNPGASVPLEGKHRVMPTRGSHRHEHSQVAASEHSASPRSYVETQPVAVCATCGVIEGVRAIQQRGQGTGLGAVAGGVLGGVVGNQLGKGGGKTALTLLGALGGGLAGNEVERRERTLTAYEVRVRMDDGSLRSFTQSTEPVPGTRVELDGQSFHAVNHGGLGREPRLIQTSGRGV